MLSENQKASFSELSAKNAASVSQAAGKRLALLFDDGVYTQLDTFAGTGVLTAYGYVDGNPVYAFAQDPAADGGAVGKAHADKVCRLLELASRSGAPVVGIYDSIGGYIEEGTDLLNAYGEMLMHISNLSGVVPQISVISGVCAGTSAMLAASADFVVMTENAELYLNPPSMSQKGKGTAEDAAKSGLASVVAENDEKAMEAARKILGMLPSNNLSPAPEFDFADPAKAANGTAPEIAEAIADVGSVIELSDKFGKASYTALATVGGYSVGIAATNKTADKLSSDDCAKIARFVSVCDSYSIPVITIVDNEGFDSAEPTAAVRNAARLANSYAEASCLKLSIITGKAYGAVYIAMAGANANADVVYAYEKAVISPLAPETAVEFMYHDKLSGTSDVNADRAKLAAEYAAGNCSACCAAVNGAVCEVVSPSDVRAKLIGAIEAMGGKRLTKRLPKKHGNMPF